MLQARTTLIYLALSLSHAYSTESINQAAIITMAQELAQISPTIDLANQQTILSYETDKKHSEKELLQLVTMILQESVPSEHLSTVKTLKEAKSTLIDMLKKYTATQGNLMHHTDIAFFVGGTSANITIPFCNNQGQQEQRSYKLDLSTIGYKLDMGYQVDAVFFTNPAAFNFHDTQTPIKLGRGIRLDITIPLALSKDDSTSFVMFGETFPKLPTQWRPFILNLTYVPFQDIAGGILLVGISAHYFNSPAVLPFWLDLLNMVAGTGISMVSSGGTLTPNKHK